MDLIDFLSKITLGTPKERFERAKLISDYIGMVTRLGFLVALLFWFSLHGSATTFLNGFPGLEFMFFLALKIMIAVIYSALALVPIGLIIGKKARVDQKDNGEGHANLSDHFDATELRHSCKSTLTTIGVSLSYVSAKATYILWTLCVAAIGFGLATQALFVNLPK